MGPKKLQTIIWSTMQIQNITNTPILNIPHFPTFLGYILQITSVFIPL